MARIKLTNVRASYVTLAEPKAIADGEPKYSISIIIEPTNPTLVVLKNEIIKVLGETKWTDHQKETADFGLRNGTEQRGDDPAYNGNFYINAKSKKQPKLVDASANKADADLFYSGCYINVFVTVYAYDRAGKKGISFSLDGAQFVKNGDPLGNDLSDDAFEPCEAVDVTSEDFDIFG